MNGRNKNEGFSLIEVVIAMAIFAVGFLAIAAMQIDANTKTVSAREVTEALQLATAQAELLQGLPLYDDRLDLDGNGAVEQFDIPAEFVDGDHNAAAGRYTIQWTVSTTDEVSPNVYSPTNTPDPLPLVKNIEIRVFETARPARIMAELEMSKIWNRDG